MALESSPEAPQPLGRVVQAVKGWVERCNAIWVEAQIIEIKRRAAATQFLVFRDLRAETSATVSCSSRVLDAAGPLSEGTTVTALIRPTVWSKNSSLTFECSELRPSGEGRLLAQLEQRKRLLQAEGLFDPRRKKPLPFLPRGIGLITGANSAAERDVLTNIHLRWPAAQVVVRNALVQGPNAAEDVMLAIAELDTQPQVEVIIIARGGGSLEDLLPFSDEGVVRAVAGAATPVMSAIGHEPDSPILDLVADVRASTPTDAAKRVVPDVFEETERISSARQRIRQALSIRLDGEQEWLNQTRSRPVLSEPTASFDAHGERIGELRRRLALAIDHRLSAESQSLTNDLNRVRSMSPKATLERGYAILVDGANDSVSSVHDVDPGDDLIAHLADGHLVLETREIHPRTPMEDTA